MFLKVKELQDAGKKILNALDNEIQTTVSDTLELNCVGKKLYLNVTNQEYYVSVALDLDVEDNFRFVVDAKLFLALISKITTTDIELTQNGNALEISANGKYKIPLIYDSLSQNKGLIELPKIIINNKTLEFDIDGAILSDILNYNSTEVSTDNKVRQVQRMYYIDEQGCITFTSGACVNSFTLPKPVKLLLPSKLVKLFKLFKKETVHFSLGYDALQNGMIQSKVSFESASTSITAIILGDPAILNTVPVTAIRERASKQYDYSMDIQKQAMVDAIGRLMLFNQSVQNALFKDLGTLEFNSTGIKIYDYNKNNSEFIGYLGLGEDCVAINFTVTMDLQYLKMVLESCMEQDVNISFGDPQAIVISRNNIKNIVPTARV